MFTAAVMSARWSCVLQYRLNGDSTFAHSSSQLVGSPLSHALAALAQQAELTSASQPWYAYQARRTGAQVGKSCCPPPGDEPELVLVAATHLLRLALLRRAVLELSWHGGHSHHVGQNHQRECAHHALANPRRTASATRCSASPRPRATRQRAPARTRYSGENVRTCAARGGRRGGRDQVTDDARCSGASVFRISERPRVNDEQPVTHHGSSAADN